MAARLSGRFEFAYRRLAKPQPGPSHAARSILSVGLVGIVVVVGAIMMLKGMGVAYDKCGQVCWQALQQAMRNRY